MTLSSARIKTDDYFSQKFRLCKCQGYGEIIDTIQHEMNYLWKGKIVGSILFHLAQASIMKSLGAMEKKDVSDDLIKTDFLKIDEKMNY